MLANVYMRCLRKKVLPVPVNSSLASPNLEGLSEQSLKDLLAYYALPLAVRRKSWYGNFYFVVERVTMTGRATGKRYRNGKFYDNWSCSIHDLFLLNNPSDISEITVEKNVPLAESKSFSAIKPENPNNLNLDKSSYIKGQTRLFVQRNGKLLPALFDHFDVKNGKSVIYVNCDGHASFYAFPQTTFVFPNKDDGIAALSKKNRFIESSADILLVINAYKKLPEAQVPSSSKADEFAFETKYHNKVNEKLLQDLVLPNQKADAAHKALSDIRSNFKDDCIDARENGGYLDDHTFISYQIRSSNAERQLVSASDERFKIEMVRKKPYFARVDCGKSALELHTAYIGDSDIPGYVVDWRHPEIGNAYYLSSIFQSRNDIVIALKRIFDIQQAKLLDFNDEINLYHESSLQTNDWELETSTDSFLSRLLSVSREDKTTHDIIKTIQSEQYNIITSDFYKNAVINGCAGSGKTMILYHRISYIAYNHVFRTGKPFDPQQVYVISPSDFFENSSSSLLQKLSIDDIHHAPFEAQIENLICRYCTEHFVLPFYGILTLLECTNQKTCDFYSEETFQMLLKDVERIDSIPTLKGEYIDWLIHAAQSLLTKNGFEAVSVNSASDIEEPFRKLYRSECFIKRKPSKSDPDAKTEYYLKESITSISYENIFASLNTLDKTKNTYQSRAKKLNQYGSILNMCVSDHTRQYSNGIVSTDIGGFWKILENPSTFEKFSALIISEKLFHMAYGERYSGQDYLLKCAFVFQNQISSEYIDKAGLYYLKALTCRYGALVKDAAFIYVDEFQNYSVFELQCIKDAFSNPVFNLYGDFDQRIEEKGSALSSALDDMLSPQMYNLNFNYRNAKQITEYINKVVYKNMQPIGINGAVSESNYFDCKFSKHNRTAVIAKDTQLVNMLLHLRFGKGFLKLASETKTVDEEELMLLSVYECRGLEFDTVYVFQAGLSENEKYVAYTRALDHLVIITDEDLRSIKDAEETRVRQENEKRHTPKCADQLSETIPGQNQHGPSEESSVSTKAFTDDQCSSIYWEALQLFTSEDPDELAYAVSLLENIAEWKDSKSKITAFKKRIASVKNDQENQQRTIYRTNKRCQYCGGKFKGIFSKTCANCGRKKDY